MKEFVHEGGCPCGAVRYRTRGDPVFVNVCNCTFCQRRTGSAFGISVIFNEADVETTGTRGVFEHRSDESHRWLRMEFCPTCGTTVGWKAEVRPGMHAIAGGTFDDPKWFKINRFIWARSAHSWVRPPPGAEVFDTAAPSPRVTG
jgi:hypothetical protein